MRILNLSIFLTLFVGLSSFTSTEVKEAPQFGVWTIEDVRMTEICGEGAFAMTGVLVHTDMYSGKVTVYRRFTADCDGNITWGPAKIDESGLSDEEMAVVLHQTLDDAGY